MYCNFGAAQMSFGFGSVMFGGAKTDNDRAKLCQAANEQAESVVLNGAGDPNWMPSEVARSKFQAAPLEFGLGPKYDLKSLESKVEVLKDVVNITLNASEVLLLPEIEWFFDKYLGWFRVKRLYFEYRAKDWSPYLFSIVRCMCRKLLIFLLKRDMEVFFPSLVETLRKRCDTIISNVRFSSRRITGIRKSSKRSGKSMAAKKRRKDRYAFRQNWFNNTGVQFRVAPTKPMSTIDRMKVGHEKLKDWKKKVVRKLYKNSTFEAFFCS